MKFSVRLSIYDEKIFLSTLFINITPKGWLLKITLEYLLILNYSFFELKVKLYTT